MQLNVTMRISVNGQAHHLAAPTTLADLLVVLGLAGKRIAVERNGEVVPRSQHAKTAVHDGDRLEIIVAVGGG